MKTSNSKSVATSLFLSAAIALGLFLYAFSGTRSSIETRISASPPGNVQQQSPGSLSPPGQRDAILDEGGLSGKTFVYDLCGSMFVQLIGPSDLSNEASSPVQASATTSIRGRVQVRIMELNAALGEYDVCVQLLNPSLNGGVDGGRMIEAPAALLAELEEPFAARIQNNGAVRGFRFSEHTSNETSCLLADIFSQTHAFDSKCSSTPWETDGLVDRTGKWVAVFTPFTSGRADDLSDSVLREKLALLPVENSDSPSNDVTVEESRSTARWSGGWFAEVHVREAYLCATAQARIRIVYDLIRTGESASEFACTNTGAPFVWPIEAPDHRVLGGRSKARSYEELVQLLDALVGAGDFKSEELFLSREELARLASQDPSLVQRLVADILARGITNNAMALVGTLGRAGGLGSQEASAMLGAVAQRTDLDPEFRRGVIAAGHQLVAATAAPFASALVAMFQNEQDDALRDQLLLTGAGMAHRLDQADPLRSAIAQCMIRELPAAESRGGLETWIAAAGQSGSPELEPRLIALLDDPRPEVSLAVAERGVCLGTAALGEAVRRRVLEPGSTEFKLAAIEGLSRGDGVQRNEVILRMIAATAPEAEVREAAASVLTLLDPSDS